MPLLTLTLGREEGLTEDSLPLPAPSHICSKANWNIGAFFQTKNPGLNTTIFKEKQEEKNTQGKNKQVKLRYSAPTIHKQNQSKSTFK